MKRIYLLLSLSIIFSFTQAQLIINELSQGTGTKEYVELLVTGTPVCGGANTVDLRGWIIDDNNSWHGNNGIAGGHVRFANIAQWASVKIGSLILIYNDADMSPAVAALGVDTNDVNGNCVYVVPISSAVLDKNNNIPASSGTMVSYALGSPTYTSTGNWVILGMANGGDAFHTVSPANYAIPYHAIGWGGTGDSAKLNVFFSGSQSGEVIYMANMVDNNPFNAANYVDSAILNNETPGLPNNAANAAWIASLNHNCQPFVSPSISINTPAQITCSNATSILTASSSTSGLIYTWSNSVTGANDTVSAAGTYYVTATDGGGICTTIDSVTVTSVNSLSISITPSNTTCGNSNGSAWVSVVNGTANGYAWSNGGTNNLIGGLAAGTYHVTVTGSGGCSAVDSVEILSSSLTPVTISSAATVLCGGDSTRICAPGGYVSYLWNLGGTDSCIFAKQAGNYYVTVTDQANCTATSNHLPLNYYPVPSVSISVNGDSLTSNNATGYQWYLNNSPIPNATSALYVATVTGNYTVEVTDANGCHATSNPTTITITSIDKLNSSEGVTVYPNPLSAGSWQLNVGENLIGSVVEVFEADGRLVFKAIITSQKTAIELEAAKGVYLMKVSSKQQTITKKLIRL